jgi:hypothetical protein
MKKLNWGPFICKTNIKNNFRLELLEESFKQKIPYNKYLVGKIKNEKAFSKEIQEKFKPKILTYISEYFTKLLEETNLEYKPNEFGFNLEDLWVNFQKKGEYNPPHSHSGHISFVIYLNIPNEIKDEINNTNGFKNASISFMYGTNTSLLMESAITNVVNIDDIATKLFTPITTINHLPENGEMFIFPSYLIHYVEAFNTENVERISISGNITIFDTKIKSLI